MTEGGTTPVGVLVRPSGRAPSPLVFLDPALDPPVGEAHAEVAPDAGAPDAGAPDAGDGAASKVLAFGARRVVAAGVLGAALLGGVLAWVLPGGSSVDPSTAQEWAAAATAGRAVISVGGASVGQVHASAGTTAPDVATASAPPPAPPASVPVSASPAPLASVPSSGPAPAAPSTAPPVTAPPATATPAAAPVGTGGVPGSVAQIAGQIIAAVDQLSHGRYRIPQSAENMLLLSRWMANEGGLWADNPLNTSLDTAKYPHQFTTSGEDTGIPIFPTMDDGVLATATTLLQNRAYAGILDVLAQGNGSCLDFANAVIRSPWASSHYGYDTTRFCGASPSEAVVPGGPFRRTRHHGVHGNGLHARHGTGQHAGHGTGQHAGPPWHRRLRRG